MDGGAHHLGDVDGAGHELGRVVGEGDVLRTDAERDVLRGDALCGEALLLCLAGDERCVADLDLVGVAVLGELRVEEVHLRDADEACDEEVRWVVEQLLRGADLLDNAVPHDHDAVAEGHGLGLVVRDVDERGVDALAELDDLCTHLVAELCVQVGERLVHEQDLGLTHDGAADGDALALAAGKCLRLAVEVLGDAQDGGGLLDLLVDLVLRDVAQLQGERHVLAHGHVRIQGVALEDHGDVAVLGGHVVHELAVDVQLAGGDLLQAGHHAQRGGLTAAGRANKHNELAVGDVEVEVLDGEDAALDLLEIALLLGSILLLAEEMLLLTLDVGVDLLDVLQAYLCH